MENLQEQIEDKIIDQINSGAGGRLVIFKPEKNKFGEDLAIERRGKYKESQMYFQVINLQEPEFEKDFEQEKFKTDQNFYMMFCSFDEIKQKIGDKIWLVPSLEFRDIAENIKSSGGKNMFKFKSSFEITDKYSKYVVEVKELGKMILDAFGNKGKFIFKDAGFAEKKEINLESLKEFLCEARRNTYASNSTPIDNPRLSGSVQLEFQKGNYSYRDIYFLGDQKFIGQEIIYQNSKPVWGMNYFGDIIGKLEDNFLKESLFKLSEKCRIGQTCEYEKREHKYQDNGSGNLENFSGQEEIFLQGKNIYKLNYQGGLI